MRAALGLRQRKSALGARKLTLVGGRKGLVKKILNPLHMEWFETLFTNTDSAAHIVLLFSIVISVGIALGRIKFGSISLGVTFVLFVGILVGHLYQAAGVGSQYGGYACPAKVLDFIQDFGLILFVYCIGLQVGPGFFQSFKTDGLKMNMLTMGIVLLNVIVLLGLYFLAFDTTDPTSFPMAVGVLSGAVTNTPGLGAAQEALSTVGIDMGEQNIANGYACAYPLGVVGIIGATIAIRYICRVKLEQEEEQIRKQQEENPHAKPYHMSLRVENKALEGRTILQLTNFLGRSFVATHYKNGAEIFTPNKDTILHLGDEMYTTCSEEDADAVTAFVGSRIEVDWQATEAPIVSKRILVTQSSVNGKTFGQMHFSSLYGVNVTRITRTGMDLFAARNLRIQIGDRLMVVGPEDAVNRVERLLGNSVKRLDHPNVGAIFLGILVGVIFGSLPFTCPGMSTPLKLGLAGGPLIIAILAGCYGYKLKLVTYTTTSANLLLREIGLILFLSAVGIKAGKNFWGTVANGDGLTYVWVGFLVTIIPLLVMGIIGRVKMKLNYFTLMGVIAGSTTDPPALGYANQTANNDAASVGYSTVYPLAMFLRIFVAQALILFMCGV